MSIEIKELVIRAVVPAKGERPMSTSSAAPAAPGEDPRDAIVEAAVKQVLRILRASRER